tara:strand:+ start:212 stop:1804 length:1593 start_codon:yes stop_codon:yes gene_type:complete
MKSSFKEINWHYFFIFILSLNYLIPYIIFNNITLFYHDALDSEIVYNSVLGKIFRNGSEEIQILLNEQIKIEYLRRAFQPLTLLYGIFNVELAYWITDAFVKLTSYFSFYLLAKKIYQKNLICYLVACLYASINLPTLSALGTAIFPYIIYLLIYKDKLKFKNYIIIFFFGLSSDFVTTIIALPFLLLLIISIRDGNDKLDINKYFKILFIFCFSIIISNFNLILLSLSDEVMHRTEFMSESLPFFEIIKDFFTNLFRITYGLNWSLASNLPIMLLIPFIFFFSFFIKNNKAINVLLVIIFLQFLIVLLKVDFVVNFYNNTEGLVRTLNPGYAETIFPLLYCILTLIILTQNKLYFSKILKTIVMICILLSQINSSMVPFYKKFILKEENYQNLYTFEGYYLYDDYKKIKKITKNSKTISIGMDPMIAVINGIYTIDGYHNVYPLSYKKKFYKIIENELNENSNTKKYFLNWGSRVYAFVNNPQDIKINFEKAKGIGAEYVISKYELNNEKLSLVCKNCSIYFKLYKINL